MGCLFVIIFVVFLVVGYFVFVVRGSIVEILFEFVDNNIIYKLNEDILGKILEF